MGADFIRPNDPRWKEFLANADYDFYHLPEYVSFSAKYEGGEAAAVLAEENGTAMLIPLLLRPLPEGLGAVDAGLDALSPYGYPAPILNKTANENVVSGLLQQFVAQAKDLGILSVFIRMHPLLSFPLKSLQNFGLLVQHGQTVHCDLNLPAEAMLQQTCSNHKRNIRKLTKNGFRSVRNDWSYWPQFMEVYRTTMRRVGAKDFYLFSDGYFEDLKEALKDKLDLWVVLSPEGELAAGAVFTVVEGMIQYHLGGTAENYLSVAPSKLMFADVRNWGKEAGHRLLHLGGGLGAEADSLFRFKAGFSTSCSDFFTFRMILDQTKYDDLEEQWRSLSGQARREGESFPVYRQAF